MVSTTTRRGIVDLLACSGLSRVTQLGRHIIMRALHNHDSPYRAAHEQSRLSAAWPEARRRHLVQTSLSCPATRVGVERADFRSLQ